MKKRPLLTVVVPVYHTPPRLLERCLNSLKACRVPEMEIILADDGNRKNDAPETVTFLENAAAHDAGIRVLRFAHGGVSRTRNAAAAASRGEYISFLDADDEWIPDRLSFILQTLENEKPDLLIAAVSRSAAQSSTVQEEEDGKLLRTEESGEDGRVLSADRLRRYYITMSDPLLNRGKIWINRAPHARFVRRELALDTPFREDLSFGEDVIWNFDLLHGASSVFVYMQQLYCYHQTDGSATQRFRPDFPGELDSLMKLYENELGSWPGQTEKLLACAAVEYFTVMCRVYVFAGGKELSGKRFLEEMKKPFWRKSFRTARLKDLRNKYRPAVILGRLHAWRLLFILCRIHYAPVHG